MLRFIGGSVAATVAVILTVVGLIFGGVYFAAFYSKTTANTRGETSQRERTKANGAFRQATYEEFFDLCASVQAAETKVAILADEAKKAQDPNRFDRINTSVTAILASRAESIATYNSKATQQHREQFQDADLPYRLDVNTKETECAA